MRREVQTSMRGQPRVVLAFDSATPVATVAVGIEGEVVMETSLQDAAGHSASLLPAIDKSMASVGLQPTDLDAIVVGGGPGSFTGVRIAAATAKGLVHALEVPLFAYSSLLATAVLGRGSKGPVCALFDARGRDLYAATYTFEPQLTVVHPPSAVTVDDLVNIFENQVPLFVGDGAIRHADELTARLGAKPQPPHFAGPRASCLIWLADNVPEMGRVPDAAVWEPSYLRLSGAERIAATKRASGATP
jgi:tRNA threonylcarbamoyladenosine biosynthesis protein TsaB